MTHSDWMRLALSLAQEGEFKTGNNPKVGCVIVKNDRIVGMGAHREFGGTHAEINALHSVNSTENLIGATWYVTLEPCAHVGKTPPCVNTLIQYQPQLVVVAMKDPHPAVSGKGIEQLKKAGIQVIIGILEAEARQLNPSFISVYENKRPWITLKWAESESGFIAPLPEDPNFETRKKLTGPWADRIVHSLRAHHQSILVGANTLFFDNPRLDVRLVPGPSPLPMVWDPNFRLAPYYHIFQKKHIRWADKSWENSSQFKPELSYIPFENPLPAFCNTLLEKGIQSVLVEGGRQVLQTFIQAGCWDQIYRFISPSNIQNGIPAPAFNHTHFRRSFWQADQLSIYLPV